MADRAEKRGYDIEIERKILEKYDPKMETEARQWIEALTGKQLEGSFHEALKSGVALCETLNAVSPGMVKKINNVKAPFLMMENIDSYLKGCKALGMPEYELFMTVDLYEARNMQQVLLNVFSLGRIAQRLGFKGPVLGVRVGATDSPARGRVPSFDSPKVTPQSPVVESAPKTTPTAPAADTTRGRAPSLENPGSERGPTVTGFKSVSAVSSPVTAAAAAPAKPAPAPAKPAPSPAQPSTPTHLDTTIDRVSKLGLDAELERKRLDKYDQGAEAEIRQWINTVTGKSLSGSFAEALRSGVVLCELVNAIKPGSIKKINRMQQPFMMMENIDSYLKACKSLGMSEFDLFMTVDLYEAQNMNQVLQNLIALRRIAQKV